MINNKVVNIISIIIIFLGLSMIPSFLFSFYYNEYDVLDICYSSLTTIICGLLLFLLTKYFSKSRKHNDLVLRDGFVIVSLGWIVISF